MQQKEQAGNMQWNLAQGIKIRRKVLKSMACKGSSKTLEQHRQWENQRKLKISSNKNYPPKNFNYWISNIWCLNPKEYIHKTKQLSYFPEFTGTCWKIHMHYKN